MLQKNQIKSVIESLLFVNGDPLSLDKLYEIIDEATKEEIVAALEELKNDLVNSGSGLIITEVAGGYQIRTSPANSNWIFRLNKIKPAKLSRASIETLSIIAYRQPITKQEVEAIRGVDSGWTIRALLEKNMVKIIGKKDEPGNPLIYATTKEFLEFFNLKSLDELPTLREYHELSELKDGLVEEPELKFSKDQ
jgi:segregation and condensation protein B